MKRKAKNTEIKKGRVTKIIPWTKKGEQKRFIESVSSAERGRLVLREKK